MTQDHWQAEFLAEHLRATRRHFLRYGAAGLAALELLPLLAADERADAAQLNPSLAAAIEQLPSWLTKPEDFQDVSRGRPKPHTLSEERLAAVGLTRDTWRLEIVSDPEHPATVQQPRAHASGNAFDFSELLALAATKGVRFPKVMTCLNIGCPLGMGIWEGVPLRDVIWLTQPRENLRRVFYYGYHNDDSQQMFRSSLPIGRVLEDPFDLPPVILCTKLNGEWLSPKRGGPVRVVVPEAYGFKSVKWLTHIVLSNIAHANDTYAEQNNDVDSDLKTFCATLGVPASPVAGQPIPLTGWAQSGISGLKRVQVWIQDNGQPWPDDDPYFTQAPWREAEILAPPKSFADDLVENTILGPLHGFSPETGQPLYWPLRLAKAHWAILHPGLPAGEYTLRCRTIDEKGAAQPMPRPFRKSGHAAIEQRRMVIA